MIRREVRNVALANVQSACVRTCVRESPRSVQNNIGSHQGPAIQVYLPQQAEDILLRLEPIGGVSAVHVYQGR